MAEFLSFPWQNWSLPIASWLLTYAVHSTIFLGGVWLFMRLGQELPLSYKEILWKAALLGSLLTSTIQVGTGVGLFTTDVAAFGSDGKPVSLTAVETRPRIRTAAERPVGLQTRFEERAFTQSLAPHILIATADQDSNQPVDRSWSLLLTLGWLSAGIVVLGIRMIQRRRYFWKMGPRRPVTDDRAGNILHELCRKAGCKRSIRLTAASDLNSPIALGNREICLPERALEDLSNAQLKSLLAHELAHLRRRDPIWLWICTVIESLLFFQPLNRLARKHLRHLFEHACDTWAVQMTGRAKPLARLLLQVAQWDRSASQAVGISGMAARGSSLAERIQRLSNYDCRRSAMQTTTWKPLVLATLVTGLIACTAPGVTVRQEQDQESSNESPVTNESVVVEDQVPTIDSLLTDEQVAVRHQIIVVDSLLNEGLMVELDQEIDLDSLLTEEVLIDLKQIEQEFAADSLVAYMDFMEADSLIAYVDSMEIVVPPVPLLAPGSLPLVVPPPQPLVPPAITDADSLAELRRQLHELRAAFQEKAQVLRQQMQTLREQQQELMQEYVQARAQLRQNRMQQFLERQHERAEEMQERAEEVRERLLERRDSLQLKREQWLEQFNEQFQYQQEQREEILQQYLHQDDSTTVAVVRI